MKIAPPVIGLLVAISILIVTKAAIAQPVFSATLVSNGLAQATIVLGADSTDVEIFAAQELQKYIHTISGATLPIATDGADDSSPCQIILGTPDSNSGIPQLQTAGQIPFFTPDYPGFDGYLVKSLPGGSNRVLAIVANQPRAVLYAVYAFLENNLGVRFFGFGAAEEVVPAMTTISVGAIDDWQKPQYKFRIANNNNFLPTDGVTLTNVTDWAAKNRLNVFLLNPLEPNPAATDVITRRGMEIWGGGHIWGSLVPVQSLLATHPEYFPQINGVRACTGISLCYSNTTAVGIFVSNAVAYAKQRPRMSVFACWPEDGPQQWAQCQCVFCKQHNFSAWNLYLINAVAQAFAADLDLSSMRIQWIAYNEGSVPPSFGVPYNHGANIDLLYANQVRDYLSPMSSSTNQQPADWLFNFPDDISIITDFKSNPTVDDLAAYQRLNAITQYLTNAQYNGNLSVLEYVNAHIGYWLDLPYMQYVQSGPWYPGVFQNDMQFYLAQGITGWSDCFDWLNDAPDPYWNRLAAQLLWDPTADVPTIEADFYAKFYGPAGQTLQTYFDTLWQLLARKKPQWSDYASLKAIYPLLIQAQGSVSGNPVYANRVASALTWYSFVRLAKSSSELIDDGSFEGRTLSAGTSATYSGSIPQDTTGTWRIVHPASNANVQASDGVNYLQSSGANCNVTILSSNYVFEANTYYKLDLDIFPVDLSGSLELVAESPQSPGTRVVLVDKTLSTLTSNQWNHVTLVWRCVPGSAEEGIPLGLYCKNFQAVDLDHIVLKLSSAAEATLSFSQQPLPAAVTCYTNARMTFTASAQSLLPIYYRWRTNSVYLPGATNSTLSSSSLVLTPGKSYNLTLEASNVLGKIISSPASLTVITNPAAVSTTVYRDSFASAGSVPLNGRVPEVSTGGAAWLAGSGMSVTGGSLPYPGHWENYLPFTPRWGHLYTLSVDINVLTGNTDWLAVGFVNAPDVNSGGFYIGATAWALIRANRQEIVTFDNNFNGQQSYGPEWCFDPTGYTTLTVALDTTTGNITANTGWTVYYIENGVLLGSAPYHVYGNNPTNLYVGIGGDNNVTGVFDNLLVTDTTLSLGIQRNGSNMTLTWPQGILLEAPTVHGPWITNSAVSPYIVFPRLNQRFYRVRLP